MPIRSDGEETRNRILQSAGRAFGKHGFRKATNQDISAQCGANSAAISYYFRDKAGLYRETWAYLQKISSDKYLSWLDAAKEDRKVDRSPLRGVAREMELARLKRLCRSLFDWMNDDTCCDSEILRYEMTEPTGELEAPEQDAVVWPLKQEIKTSLSLLLNVSPDSLSVVLGAQGIVARFRDHFMIDCADLAMWSLDERFECMYASFLRSVELGESSSSQKTAKKAAAPDEASHPELGVTDEVDTFTLKPLTKLDLLLMKKAEHDEKKNAKQEEDSLPIDEQGKEEDPPGFLQPELW